MTAAQQPKWYEPHCRCFSKNAYILLHASCRVFEEGSGCSSSAEDRQLESLPADDCCANACKAECLGTSGTLTRNAVGMSQLYTVTHSVHQALCIVWLVCRRCHTLLCAESSFLLSRWSSDVKNACPASSYIWSSNCPPLSFTFFTNCSTSCHRCTQALAATAPCTNNSCSTCEELLTHCLPSKGAGSLQDRFFPGKFCCCVSLGFS